MFDQRRFQLFPILVELMTIDVDRQTQNNQDGDSEQPFGIELLCIRPGLVLILELG